MTSSSQPTPSPTETATANGVEKRPLSFLTMPNPDINYDVILASYAVCCCLCAFLYALEKMLFSESMDGREFIVENRESAKGLYVVFMPFFPCLIWAAAMRTRAASSSSSGGGKEKEE
uniref:Uncharacterized protein n=1 Tax=Corethron hystrix TaxID=216773 RepID=A0A6U5ITV3_9STRA